MSDQQFAGFAALLFADLVDLFQNLGTEKDNCDTVAAMQTEAGIKHYLAERSYDLVSHATAYFIGEGDIEQGTLEYILPRVPDLPAWPRGNNKEETTHHGPH